MAKANNDNKYEIIRRFRVRENGHVVHYYEVEFEDGTTDVLPGMFAYAYQDEDEPCIYCGSMPRKKLRQMCEDCITKGVGG